MSASDPLVLSDLPAAMQAVINTQATENADGNARFLCVAYYLDPGVDPALRQYLGWQLRASNQQGSVAEAEALDDHDLGPYWEVIETMAAPQPVVFGYLGTHEPPGKKRLYVYASRPGLGLSLESDLVVEGHSNTGVFPYGDELGWHVAVPPSVWDRPVEPDALKFPLAPLEPRNREDWVVLEHAGTGDDLRLVEWNFITGEVRSTGPTVVHNPPVAPA